MQEFSLRLITIFRNIPPGRVITYGDAAAAAGSPRSARQAARLLHTASRAYELPWHRVIGSGGKILLPEGRGFEEQIMLLRSEGVEVTDRGVVEIGRYRWAISLK